MSGYSKFEQTIGKLLDRFPRIKRAVETVYQRASYHLLADSNFEYEIHDEVTIERVDEAFNIEDLGECFVGFYDVCPWNESMDQFLLHELCGEELAIVVLEEGTKREVAKTSAWNYQQGSRAQWHPTMEGVVVFNDFDGRNPVTRIVDIDGEQLKRYEGHVQAVNPTGGDLLSVDYRRYDRNSPAYGYGHDDGGSLAKPAEDGIVRVDTDGSREVIVPFSMLISDAGSEVEPGRHYVHHALYSPDGDRFVFLHRWREGNRRRTRLCVSDLTGEVKEVLAHDSLSHYSWLDDNRLFLWGGSMEYGRGYHVVNVDTGRLECVSKLNAFGDGHPSVSPNRDWVVMDTYPDRTRVRSLWLYNVQSEGLVCIGEFFSPFEFDGSNRCDLHPRWSPDAEYVSIDSAHEKKRSVHIIKHIPLNIDSARKDDFI